MKVGIFDPYLDDLGGGEKYMMTVASCLSEKHQVTIFWDKRDDIIACQKRFHLPLEQIKLHKNIFSSHVTFWERMKTAWKYDAIIILSDGSIPFIYPTKLFIHIQQPLAISKSRSFKDKIKEKHISAIFYNSQFTKKYNDSLFSGIYSQIIYPPVSLYKKSQNGEEKKENCIVHVGRFRTSSNASGDYKKQGFMVDAFKELVTQGLKGWTFHIASSVRKEDEEKFATLQKNAKGYPIVFHINKTQHELFDLYTKAKIYWHASGYGEDISTHPELAEHFGMTTVEAMSAGVVPVVINTGGQKEIVTNGKNGLLWETREELLQKTKLAAENKILWHELSQNAIIRAKDFGEEKFAEAIQNLII